MSDEPFIIRKSSRQSRQMLCFAEFRGDLTNILIFLKNIKIFVKVVGIVPIAMETELPISRLQIFGG